MDSSINLFQYIKINTILNNHKYSIERSTRYVLIIYRHCGFCRFRVSKSTRRMFNAAVVFKVTRGARRTAVCLTTHALTHHKTIVLSLRNCIREIGYHEHKSVICLHLCFIYYLIYSVRILCVWVFFKFFLTLP